MVNLANELVLGKVLPKRNSLNEVVRVVEPVWAHPRERVARCTSVCACGEEARDQDQRKNSFGISMENLSMLVVGTHLFNAVYDGFLRPAQQTATLPEAYGIETVCKSSVCSKSIWAYSRCLIKLFCFFLVHETAFHHPPSNGSLNTTKQKQGAKGSLQPCLEIATPPEIRERNEKGEPNRPADNSVEPFPKEYVLKSIYIHSFFRINLNPFRTLLVFFKFLFPLLLRSRR